MQAALDHLPDGAAIVNVDVGEQATRATIS